ncbi:MAG TPA: IS3 family transposase [Lacipirellula sp.]
MSPSRKREAVVKLQDQFATSERRACQILNQPRSSQRRKTRPRDDEPAVIKRMLELARERPRFGYRRIAALLRQEGFRASATRILRLWRKEGLKVPKKKRKRRAVGTSAASVVARPAQAPNDVWCWDFVFDRTASGGSLKWLSIVDEFTRECLVLKVDRGITSEAVIDWLAELLAMRGVPKCIRSDNGPEFIARAIRKWLAQVGVQTLYVQPGSPWQNGYAESFHSRLRDEFLAMEEFESLAAARQLTAAFRDDYNHHRPHGSLGYQAPAAFAARWAASATESLSATPQATPPLQQPSGVYPTPTFITGGTGI